jgi:dTDP-4-dehydrorhamnose reductase
MLGRDLVTVLRGRGEAVVASTRDDLDITHERRVRAAVREHRPDIVVNCAAWTAVDDAEADQEGAMAVNGAGARHLARACTSAGARLVQVSTDYVFGGDGGRPYAEDDPTAPGTAYGRTKLAGERAVLDLLPGSAYVVRTAWLYGAHGANFVRTMLKLAAGSDPVHVVDDQWGQPTWTMDVAERIVALARSGAAGTGAAGTGAAGTGAAAAAAGTGAAGGAGAAPGVYHVTSSGQTTWFRLAQEVFRLAGADLARVRAVTSDAYPRPAKRPAYSVLGHARWAGTRIQPIGPWRDALERAFPALTAAWPSRPLAGSPSVSSAAKP